MRSYCPRKWELYTSSLATFCPLSVEILLILDHEEPDGLTFDRGSVNGPETPNELVYLTDFFNKNLHWSILSGKFRTNIFITAFIK